MSFSLEIDCKRQGELSSYNNVFRQRFKLAYNIKGTKLEPAVSTEYFYHLTRHWNS